LVKLKITDWVERLNTVVDILKEGDDGKNAALPSLIEAVELSIQYISKAPVVKSSLTLDKMIDNLIKEMMSGSK
tara:strand:- start:57 stop:278 length:222 start_codon:yes stop_codon:yes gene_type:complete